MHLSSFCLLQPLFPALFTCFRVLRGKHSTLAKFAGGWGQISWCTTSAATAGDAADGDGDGDDHDDDDHLLLLLLLLLMMIVTMFLMPIRPGCFVLPSVARIDRGTCALGEEDPCCLRPL